MLEGVEVDELDEGHDEVKRYKSLSRGPEPIIESVPSLEAVLPRAADLLAAVIEGKVENGHTACVIAPNKAIRDQVRKYFQGRGVATHTIEANERDPQDSTKLRFSTMHRSKGLEFDQVLVIAQNSALNGDDADQYRKLAYVALTRAKKAAAMLRF